jgi:putative transposase
MVTPFDKTRAAVYLEEAYQVSERKACQVLMLNRNSKRRLQQYEPIDVVVEKVIERSVAQPRWGYRKVYDRLKLDGVCIGRERVRLIRKREGLQVRKKQHKKRHPGRSCPLLSAQYPGHVWSYDFVMDSTVDGKRLKLLTVIDEFNKQAFPIECRRSMTSGDVVRVLHKLFTIYGQPEWIRSDNGSEFIAEAVQNVLGEKGIKTRFIEPGKPWQNGYNESFNAILRDDCLNKWQFLSIREARRILDDWVDEYNDYRPHGSLGGLTPNLFQERWDHEHRQKQAA